MSVSGQKRRFDPLPVTSGPPRLTDIARPARLVDGGVGQRALRPFCCLSAYATVSAMPHLSKPNAEQVPNVDARPNADANASSAPPVDPRAFGLVKAAYSVREVMELLSIGRTSLYAAVRRGELRRIKLGKRTLFCATDLAAFLVRLRSQETRPAAARQA
jgi:excisionase family DNA binding protein